jgi:fructokinase
VIGGGVANARPELLALTRAQLRRSLNDYVGVGRSPEGLTGFIVPPGLGALAGPLGAIAVAAEAHLTGA